MVAKSTYENKEHRAIVKEAVAKKLSRGVKASVSYGVAGAAEVGVSVEA